MRTLIKIQLLLLCMATWAMGQTTNLQETETPITSTPSSNQFSANISDNLFRLYPNNLEIRCEDNTPITFFVQNIYNTPGNIYYRWIIGQGWTNAQGVPVSGTILTATNQLTLIPSSSSPSNVVVIPVFNSYTTRTLYCSVSIKPYYGSSYITGNTTICSGSSTFTYNLQSGETATWTVSDPALATLANTTGSQVTLNKIGEGNVTLTATITNSCGQSTTRSIRVGLGVPIITKPNCGGFVILDPSGEFPDNSECDMCRTYHYYIDKNVIQAEATGGGILTWEWQKITTNFNWTTSTNTAYFQPSQMGTIMFKVRAGNTCGWSAWRPQQITISRDCTDDNGENFRMSATTETPMTSANYFNLYPNPASSIVYLELVNRERIPAATTTISAELFDFYGFSKGSVLVDNYKASIDVSNLPKGTYILKVMVDGKIESHQVVVE